MSKKKKLIPELRFPEFKNEGEWNVKRLVDIGNIKQGFGFPISYQGNKNGKFPFIKVSDISNAVQKGKLEIDEAVNYISSNDVVELKVKTIPIGTTVFAKIGEAIRLNRRAITCCESLIDNNVAGVKSIDGKTTDRFVYYILSKIDLLEYSGGAIPSVNKTTLENIPIIIPISLKEQKKIASCLSSLDEVIAAYNQKLDLLKVHKNGLMQNLFPIEGEKVPKYRFPEFKKDGEWKKMTLGEISKITSGGTPNRSKSQYWNGDIPWISTTLIDFNIINEANEYITEVGLQNSSAKIFPKGTILMAMYGQGKTRGKVGVLGIDAATNQACAAILLKKEYSTDYVFQYLAAHYDEIRELSNKGGQENLSGGLIENIQLSISTNLKEQQKIASCLSTLDELITAQTEKIEQLKLHKKGLMQGLFPKIIE